MTNITPTVIKLLKKNDPTITKNHNLYVINCHFNDRDK